MIIKIIDVLTLALFANQVIHVFGELLILRGFQGDDLYHKIQEAICISEDDGGALTFIYDSDYENKVFIIIKEFYSQCNITNICKMDDEKGCLSRWSREGWKLTNSMDTPMGPVFDQRWEAFTEYGSGTEYNINLSNVSKIVVPFSVRARSDVNILICKNKYKTNLCYWVIIGAWDNTKSLIRKCPTGVLIHEYPQDNSKCTEHVYLNHKPLSLYEWRTFILTWNTATRNISLYDPDQLIMTYEDMEDYENSNIFHGISFPTTQNHSFIRYHNYTFLYTRNHTSTLLSPTYQFANKTICFQLLIGLCAVCDATVAMIDVATKNRIGSVEINGSSTAHGLPMWQFITIRYLLPPINNRVKLEVIPRYSTPNSNPLWAIGNIRVCVPKSCTRTSGHVFSYELRPHLVLCQKLFYQEHSVVDFFSDAKLNEDLDNENCDFALLIPRCVYTCGLYPQDQKVLLDQTKCRTLTICNKYGCTCAPGYRGPMCNQPCNKGLYGYDCKKKCGSCHQNESCGPTGECPTGCKNRANYTYVPPLCHIAIDKPDEPEIIFTNQTTIVATSQINWKEEYKKEKLFHSFHIELLDGRSIYQEKWKQLFGITNHQIQLIGTFKDLEPGIPYKIRSIVSIAQLEITSDWKIVETNCSLPDAPRNFTYSFKSNGVVDLKWFHPWKMCGYDLCCFRITIQEILSSLTNNTLRSSKYEILKNSSTHNTHNYEKRLYLLSSTLYKISIQTVTIQNKSSITNSLELSTPSSVGLNGELEIHTQISDSLILLRIPRVLNNTYNSITHIVVIGPNICEQNAKLPKNLLVHVGKEKINHVLQVVERSTDELANKVFTISSNHSASCPLKNGELCEIMFIITESDFPEKGIIFAKKISFYFGGPPPTYFEIWFICTILFLATLSGVFYYYKK